MTTQLRRTIRAIVAVAFVSPTFPATAAPTDAQMARCAQIDAAAERLGCYDQLAGRAPAAVQAGSPARPAPAAAAADSALPASPAAAAPAAAAPATGASAFGLTKPLPKATPEEPDSLKSHVDQVIESRFAGISVVLENGQSWAIMETEARVRPGDVVTIKRAALGSFMMITPSRRSYRVRRLQ